MRAPKHFSIPSKYEQFQSDVESNKCLQIIRDHYNGYKQGVEECATSIVCKLDSNFQDFVLTRPWRDGGRDVIGHYAISTGGKINPALKMDCALKAKYDSTQNSVGVREMSRLISRIRYRQFGIMVTTSFVNKQAYGEVVEDEHPILIIAASDIAGVLRNNAINSSNINEWLDSIDSQMTKNRLMMYYSKLQERKRNLHV